MRFRLRRSRVEREGCQEQMKAELKQMYSLLQDLENSMNSTKQRLEEHQELMAQY